MRRCVSPMGGRQTQMVRPFTFILQMYKYGGAEGGHEELRNFCTSGFREVQALDVPPMPSPLEALLKAVRRNPWIVRAMEVKRTKAYPFRVLALVCMCSYG